MGSSGDPSGVLAGSARAAGALLRRRIQDGQKWVVLGHR